MGANPLQGLLEGVGPDIETFLSLEMKAREGTLTFNTEQTKCWVVNQITQ